MGSFVYFDEDVPEFLVCAYSDENYTVEFYLDDLRAFIRVAR